MPFKSEKQRKWMHANEPEMAKDWEKKESLKENRAKLVKNIIQVYKDLDKKFKNYDHTRITNWGKVIRHLTPKFGGNKELASHIALSYNSYRGGEDIKKNITKLIKYTQKMTGKKLEATTTSAVAPYDTPKAFKKSTYKAIQVDDEDDSDELIGGMRDYRKKIAKLDKKESVKEGITDRGYSELGKRGHNLPRAAKQFIMALRKKDDREIEKYIDIIADLMKWMQTTLKNPRFNESIVKEDNIKFSKEEMAQLHKDGKIEKGGHTIEFGESINESDLDMLERSGDYGWDWKNLTVKKGKTVKVTHKKSGKSLIIIDKPNVKREYEKIGYFAEGEVNEDFWALPAGWSSQEARLHLDSDIKKMSKILGKASQQVIKIMMNGVKGDRYDALDIVRGIETGPWNRTHEGERPFMKMLWNKVRNGFRRYSKDRKLRK